jgi:hypothetical protein
MLWTLAVLRMSSDLPSPPPDLWRFFDAYVDSTMRETSHIDKRASPISSILSLRPTPRSPNAADETDGTNAEHNEGGGFRHDVEHQVVASDDERSRQAVDNAACIGTQATTDYASVDKNVGARGNACQWCEGEIGELLAVERKEAHGHGDFVAFQRRTQFVIQELREVSIVGCCLLTALAD